MNIQEFRDKYPQYNDMTDQALSDAMYNKHYSDMAREDFDARWLGPSEQSEPVDQDDELGFFESWIAGPVIRGANVLQSTEAMMGMTLGWRSQEEAAKAIADAQRDHADAPISEAVQSGLEEIMTDDPERAGKWGEAAIDVLTNLPAVWDVTVSSLVSSIPGLVGFATGLVGGGAVAGPPGALVGAMSGTGVGSFATEYSNAIIDAMNKNGVNTHDEQAILEFFQDDAKMAEAKEFAKNRGIPIALFDAVTAGAAGRIFGPTAKAVSGQKIALEASDAGRQAADTVRRQLQARGNVPVSRIEKSASDAALKATGRHLATRGRVAGATLELGTQMTGGAAGEAAAQYITEGEIGDPGSVILEAMAEGPVGGIQALIASQRPRVAPDPLDPSNLPEAAAPPGIEEYDAPIQSDPIEFVEQQVANFVDDAPSTFVDGSPSTNIDDYNVSPFSGKDAEGNDVLGWRVETNAGVPITPVIDNEVKAEGARQAFVDVLGDTVDTQQQSEINLRAEEALPSEMNATENPEFFQAALEGDRPTTLPFSEITPAHSKKIMDWREDNRDIAPVVPEGTFAIEEMALTPGITNTSINNYLQKSGSVARGDGVTQRSITSIAKQKNVNTEDQSFSDFVLRVAGYKGKKWKDMKPHQMQAVRERLEGEAFNILPGEGSQNIPITKRRPFTGSQYDTVVAMARRQRARDRHWRVEKKDGTKVGKKFWTKQAASNHKATLKDGGKGTRIKQYKEDKPLRQGEIYKSDVTAILGRKEKNTDAIINAAVERGDIVPVRGQKGRWRFSEYEEMDVSPLIPGLRKRLQARLRGAGIPTDKVTLSIVDALEGPSDAREGQVAEGVYNPVSRVISLALRALPENATLEEAKEILGGIMDHELIHALFHAKMGLFTAEEKGSLLRFVAGTMLPKKSNWYTPKHSKESYLSHAMRVYGDKAEYQMRDKDGNMAPNPLMIGEEAIAEAFRDFASNVLTPAGRPRSLLSRIIAFFRGITTVNPQDARYFVHKFTPIKEGLAEPARRRRRVVAGQADVDLPVDERGRRYSISERVDEVEGPKGTIQYVTNPSRRDLGLMISAQRRGAQRIDPRGDPDYSQWRMISGTEPTSIRLLRVPKRLTVWQGKARDRDGELPPRFTGGDIIAFDGLTVLHDDMIDALGLPFDVERGEVAEPVGNRQLQGNEMWWNAEREAAEGPRWSIAEEDIDGQQPDGSHPYRVSGRTPKVKNRPVGSEVADEKGFENPVTTDLPVNTDAVLRSKSRRKADDHPPVRAAKLFRRIVPNTYLGFRTRARDPEKVIRAMQDHMVENLLWLYNQVRPEVRDRAKLWYEGGRALVTRLAEQHDVPDRVVAATIAALSPQKDWYVNVSLAERVLDIHIQHTRGNKRAFLPDEAMKKKAIELFPKLKKEELNGIMSRTYEDQEDSRHKSIWLRTYDEVNNPRGYRKITPEGKWFGEPEGNVAWGSTPEIRKAVDSIEDTSKEGIHRILGTKHKIRNFYNNLLAPSSTAGDVTIDTHAVGAALILPVSGNSSEVNHNFGTSNLKKQQPEGWIATTYDGRIGAAGTYGIIADAYREAAAKAGILPREMQSITWEAVRLLFPATWKSNKLNINKVRNVWKQSERGRIKTKEEARNKILEVADGIKDPDWFNTRDRSDDAGQGSSYDGELAELRLRGRRQAGEPAAGTGRTDRGAAEGGVRYSLTDPEEAMFRNLEYRERQRRRGAYKVGASGMSGLQEEERNAARQSALEKRGIFTGFDNVTDNAFFPVKMYLGGVTKVPIDGKFYPVVMVSGHDQWSDAKDKYVGWGMKHVNHHLDDIVKNTNYNSVDDFISGILNMYHANRMVGPDALKEAGFEVFETDSFADEVRGPKTVIRWWYDQWPVPGTIVLQKIDFSKEEKVFPALKGKSFASVLSAYALPSIKGKLEPRKSQIINPNISLTGKKAAYTAKPRETFNKKLTARYSLSDPDALSPEKKTLYNKIFGGKPEGRRSLGEYLFGRRSPMEDSRKYSSPSKFRWHVVDRYEGIRWAEAELKRQMPELYSDIYADSSAAAMFSLLGRSSGLMQQAMVAAPIIYSRGLFHAINENIVNSASPELRAQLRTELAEMKRRAGYAEDEQVKGLMQIFYPLYALRNVGGFDAWAIYAAARRASRLIKENKEFTMTEKEIADGMALETDPEYMVNGVSIIKQVYDDYQKFNNTVINMMRDANLISEEAEKTWRDNSDYLPFYRELFIEDEKGGGLNGQVVFNDPGGITNQDDIALTATKEGPSSGPNNFFQNLYDIPAPHELKGGKRTYFIMVNGVRDPHIFKSNDPKTADGAELYKRLDELTALNKDTGAEVVISAGTQRIQDPLENILRNVNAAITGSMRNVGMLRAIRDLGRLNMAWKMKDQSSPSLRPKVDQIGVRVNGETVWYNTSDALLLRSIQSTGDLQHPAMGILATPANILRELVTKTPDFMLANMLRDTISAWATSGANVWPLIGTTVGFAEAVGGVGSTAQLRAAGVFGGYDFKNDPRDAKKALESYMRKGVAGAGSAKDYLTKGWVPSLRSPVAPLTKLWQFLDDVTVATDMGTRIAVYNSVLAETGNEAQAAYEALEVINFSRKGKNQAMLFLTATIPFLNARIQGLDVLWRGSPASKDGITGYNVQDRKRRFIWRMTSLVALGAAYAMLHSEDPEEDPYYANATEEKKDMYWIFKPEWFGLDPKTTWVPKIPIAFEVGLLTKTIPERIVRLINGTDDGKAFMKAMQRGVVGTLNMQPIPQFMRPAFEAAINTRLYDWSDIVPWYSQEDPAHIARPGTSSFAIEVARQTGISAELVEHMIKQYTGTLGMYALIAVDAVTDNVAGNPKAPAMDVTQYPFLRRFLQSDLGGGDAQEFYALRETLNSLTKSLSKSSPEEQQELIGENWNLLSNKSIINRLDGQVTKLREQEADIREAPDSVASPERKKKLIREIRSIRSEVLREIHQLSMESRQ